MYIILMLHNEDPNSHLIVYVDYPKRYTGTVVSTDTISQLFLHGFPFKGNLAKPDLIPLDRFRPVNEVRAFEYLDILFPLYPYRILFVDEKHFRGEEIFSRKVRKNPLENSIPDVATTSDFRTMYNVTGFCSI